MVVATVVAPHNFWAIIMGKSLLLALTIPFLCPNCSICSFVIPIMATPSIMPMVAGIAPFSKTILSTSKAVLTFSG